MSSYSRRDFILAGAALGGVVASAPRAALSATGASAVAAADDETYWAEVASHYDMTPKVVNLENGNWGVMARPVLDAFERHTERVNRENSYYSRRGYGDDLASVRQRVARQLGAGTDEIALTRGATEALQNIIGGFNLLGSGDGLMYADLDYHSVQATMDSVARRTGAALVRLEIPEPVGYEELVQFYVEAMERHPRTRLLLLTHVSHRTGLLVPVREICREARKRGIRTVVDAAHSWGQIPFQVADLQADYAGFNLHKWMGAPIGVGVMYIRRDRLRDINPNISATMEEAATIDGRVHSGTSNLATFLTVPDALAFHERIGPQAKAARLRYLRDLWVTQARQLDRIEVLTPDDPRMHAGMTSFRIRDRGTEADNQALAARLLDEFNIFSVHRTGVARGACVRITPSVYNSAADVMRFVGALKKITV